MLDTVRGALRQQVFPRLTLSHFAALLLLSASALANFRYGLELGQTDLEKFIAASASLGADLFNALGLLLVTWAWRSQRRLQALAGAFAILCTVTYSLNAGIGFAASTKDALIAERTQTATAETDRAGEKKRLQAQLSALAPARSAFELQAAMDKILADPRAQSCATLNGKYTKANCPRYFDLKAELGRAQERSKLEHELSEISNKLLVTTTAGTQPFVLSADPLGSNLVVYLGKLGLHVQPDDIRPWQSLLFVFLVVLCGPIAFWLAEERALASRKPVQTQRPSPVERPSDTSPPPPALKSEAPQSPASDKLTSRKPKVDKMPAAATTTLHKLRASGGKLQASSQNKLAETLKMSRTTMRRAIEELRHGGFINIDDNNGYALMMSR